ncbi:Aspartate/glutamate/uridylate kinase, partial [Pavlovales sp. CCMP2436]
SFYEDVVLLRQLGVNVVIVHGGGPQISGMLKELGVVAEFIDGRRVTDAKTMEVVEMVLGGLVNNKLVNAISRAGGKAIGGQRVKADLGLVGEPTHIRPQLLHDLLAVGAIPVIAPIGVGVIDGQSYNINADTAAGAVAAALGASRLLLLTDIVGVLDKNKQLIQFIIVIIIIGKTITTIMIIIITLTITTGGMIPKLETACDAVTGGVRASVILDGRVDHALLLSLLPGVGVGTVVGNMH